MPLWAGFLFLIPPLTMIVPLLMNKSPVTNEEWLGCEFMAKPDSTFLLDGIKVPHTNIDAPFTVSKVEENRLWVGEAWITQDEVIPVAESAAFYTEYVRKHPAEAWGYLSRGLAWAAVGNCDNAITDYTKAIRLAPEYAIAYYDRGLSWAEKGEFDKAIRDFNEAIRLNPEYVRAYFSRGVTLQECDEFEKAIKDQTKVIQLDPKCASAFNSRGVAWNRIGEPDKAIQDLSKAIWLDPKLAYAFSNRGSIWNIKGDYANAVNDIAEAIRLDPKDESACNEFAWLLATCPEAEFRDGLEAVILGEALCELSEWKEADYIDTLAAAYAEFGDFNQAVKSQELSLKLIDRDEEEEEYTERLTLYRAGKPYHREKVDTELA